MTASPPPSSFDPAIYFSDIPPDLPSVPPSTDLAFDLHSVPPEPPSQSYSDELEALDLVRAEKTRNKVVIQHRAWNLSDIFRSDDDIRPYTPTKPTRALQLLPSSPPVAKMPFMSSPATMPAPASPTDPQKRKSDEPPQSTEPKRPRIMGFVDEDDDEDEDALAAFGDAQLKSQFEIQEQLIEEEPVQFPILTRPSQDEPKSTSLQNSTSNPDNYTSDSYIPRTSGRFHIKTCSGKTHNVTLKPKRAPVPYEKIVAGRSTTAPGRAQKSYYGIEIHKLLDDAARETKQSEASRQPPAPAVQPSIEPGPMSHKSRKAASAMWTEKYRARKFTDLIGDERTHRWVLRWLKGWDPIVFPNLAKSRTKKFQKEEEERPHRKVLLLSGPPGLGKTTLAHVCARQAGYEVLEINASDDRSKDVVKGRIRDALATENVKGMNVEVGDSKVRKAGRPVCVIVDEVDGVVSGSGGGGEGGFMRALIDLVLLDQRNTARTSSSNAEGGKKKGDNFRFLRPLILVCNDLYHPSLRPLRASSIAEMVHVRQAPLENVVSRMKAIFIREGIPCENDGVRRLCEASWGLASKKQVGSKSSGSAEGDIRSVLVAAEWVAHKLRNDNLSSAKLTRNWLERTILNGSSEGGTFFKGLNRGGVRDIVDRVFTEGAGFPDAPVGTASFQDPFQDADTKVPVGVADIKKRHAVNRLREMVDASDEHDRCATDCFASYPIQPYQDDIFLSKPNAAYDWLHFHDSLSSKVFSSQSWELTPYLSQSVLAFHHLFATAHGKRKPQDKSDDAEDAEEEHPFSGPRADFAAFEALKQNRAILTGFQTSFSAPLVRLFRSTDSVITDLVPHLLRMLSPEVKPVVVRGNGESNAVASVRKESERVLIRLAVRAMTGLGVTFEKVRVENEGGTYGGWAYRMEPPLDSLVSFSKTKGTSMTGGSAPVRYAIRQVLDQEYRKETMRKQSDALNSSKLGARSTGKIPGGPNLESASKHTVKDLGAKRDFFGRVIEEPTRSGDDSSPKVTETSKAGRKVWVTYHDGFSNAVRKPISMAELLAGL